MEQDITEKLRIMASNLKHTAGEHTAEVLNDAANEIERLRKRIARMDEREPVSVTPKFRYPC